jgi:hypothetical protein
MADDTGLSPTVRPARKKLVKKVKKLVAVKTKKTKK